MTTFSPNREELAWAAGLFDGEGHVRRERGTDLKVAVTQVDRRVLDRFAAAVNMGGVYGPYKHLRGQPQHRYQLSGHPSTQAVCAMLWSFLSPVKREQFRRALTSAAPRPHRRFNGPCQHGSARTKGCRECQQGYMKRHLAKPRSAVRSYRRHQTTGD